MEKHYVCPCNCGGKSDGAKVCETEGCKCEGEMMKECHCTDGMHAEVMNKSDEA